MTFVFLRLVVKMSDRFLGQRSDIKFCVQLLLEMGLGAFRMMSKANGKV
jgi:hypothetical protein